MTRYYRIPFHLCISSLVLSMGHPRSQNISPNPVVLFTSMEIVLYALCHPWPTFGDALAARLSCGWKEYLLPQRNTFPIVYGFWRFPNVWPKLWFWEEVCDCQCTILSVSPSYNWTDTLTVDTAHVKHVGCVHLHCFYQAAFVASLFLIMNMFELQLKQ